MYTIENDLLKVQVRSYGAELRGITDKADGTEYLWDGNPEFWKYSSPVLFPIVGSVIDKKYRFAGKEYEIPSHGIGRISEYRLVEQKADSIRFALEYDEESLKKYPFKFRLEISYALVGRNVTVHWRVVNLDDKDIYFSIGAHPALNCPIAGKGTFEDCYLEFSAQEDTGVFELAPGCLLLHAKRQFIKGNKLSLNYDMFKEDARIFDDLKSDTIMIRSTKTDKAVGIKAPGFPYWGIWTPVKGGAPFLCIEPWHGHADYADFTGDFSEKEGVYKLPVGETFDTEYYIVTE